MTLRTVTTPYDPQTTAEIQAAVATKIGRAYSGWDTVFQTEVNRIIDNSGEYITKRFGHEPWMLHELSLSLAASTATLTLAAAARQVMTIVETYDGTTRLVTPTTKREYLLAWGAGATSHPWSQQSQPYWFLDGMDDSNPPLQQWKRVPTPDKAITATALVRPYLTLRSTTGDTQYTHLPAHAAAALMEYVYEKVLMFMGDYEQAAQHKRSMEDEIAANLIADAPEGAWETAREVGYPSWAHTEMGGP